MFRTAKTLAGILVYLANCSLNRTIELQRRMTKKAALFTNCRLKPVAIDAGSCGGQPVLMPLTAARVLLLQLLLMRLRLQMMLLLVM